ncbi:Metallo-dependent hydrolase [Violaceomyces palustris]|uniref:Metallo-dependent hydrolase n=1 Tax=Violaceomyces palustris TaxID=1673888 RepID=A0ACD0NTG7_9BASI|nr:Metallo-dependent hydrolase [Violaceomyces palustris]
MQGEGGSSQNFQRASCPSIDVKRSLVLPGGLCHPHVHLDKGFLLERFPPEDGSFQEALTKTNQAKAAFTLEDLLQRGRRLITTSISHGVTSMRAHVEVDPTVNLVCLEAGLRLQEEFKTRCRINLSVFAQEAIFHSEDKRKEEATIKLLREAVKQGGVSCLGSAPYVEKGGMEEERRNIDLIFEMASQAGLDVDFHLDYDLDPSKETNIFYVLEKARAMSWRVRGGARRRRVTLGHCTKLSIFSQQDLDRLEEELSRKKRRSDETRIGGETISFVSLPNSDIYMQGRSEPYPTRNRATLPGLDLKERGIKVSVGINNISNLFQPQGDSDPLALLPLLVGLWQSTRPAHLESLLDMVTLSSLHSAGFDPADPPVECTDMKRFATRPDSYRNATILDACYDLASAVLSPTYGRITIFQGSIVSTRKVQSWLILE